MTQHIDTKLSQDPVSSSSQQARHPKHAAFHSACRIWRVLMMMDEAEPLYLSQQLGTAPPSSSAATQALLGQGPLAAALLPMHRLHRALMHQVISACIR